MTFTWKTSAHINGLGLKFSEDEDRGVDGFNKAEGLMTLKTLLEMLV